MAFHEHFLSMPHATSLSKRVNSVADGMRAELKGVFAEKTAAGVAVNTDIWTEDYWKRSFLGVNIHYIDSGSIADRTLAVREIEETTAKNVHKVLEEILTEGGIIMQKAVFVTDRGCKFVFLGFPFYPFNVGHCFFAANMKAALKHPYTRLDCATHITDNIERKIQANH